MKRFFILFFLLTIGFAGKAQKDTSHVVKDTLSARKKMYSKNVISVNVSSFLEKTFKPGNSPDLNTPFLYYRRNFDKFFLRLGLNGLNTSNRITNSKTNELTTVNKFYTSASLGCYIRKDIGRYFSVAYGLNIFTAYSDSSSKLTTPYDEVKNYATAMHYGIAPGVLLQYKITKRLSVFAEYTLPMQVIYGKSGIMYSLFPNENTTDRTTTNYAFQIYNPVSIYLSCSF